MTESEVDDERLQAGCAAERLTERKEGLLEQRHLAAQERLDRGVLGADD